MNRPQPPSHVVDALGAVFAPSPELEEWARATFLEPSSPLFNEDHTHLQMASLGFLWTNEPNSRGGRVVIGQCEIMPPMAMGKWQRARAIAQVEEWFGAMPDFIITISAPAAEILDDASFMALIEHELYHAAQDRDDFGMPKFRRNGRPAFAMRGHDVEEFVGVVRRYGAVATNTEALVEAANAAPEISLARIAAACGNCLKLVR